MKTALKDDNTEKVENHCSVWRSSIAKTEWNTDIYNNLDEAPKNYSEVFF